MFRSLGSAANVDGVFISTRLPEEGWMRAAIGRHFGVMFVVAVGATVLTLVGTGVGSAAPAVHSAAAHVAVASKPVGKPGGVRPANLLNVRVTQNGVNMRACASTACAVAGTANTGDSLDSWCFVSGQTPPGFSTPFWDIIYNTATGRAGFITEGLLNNVTQGFTC